VDSYAWEAADSLEAEGVQWIGQDIAFTKEGEHFLLAPVKDGANYPAIMIIGKFTFGHLGAAQRLSRPNAEMIFQLRIATYLVDVSTNRCQF
jgi:hypothetical protein